MKLMENDLEQYATFFWHLQDVYLYKSANIYMIFTYHESQFVW